jgi:hypothetical protein
MSKAPVSESPVNVSEVELSKVLTTVLVELSELSDASVEMTSDEDVPVNEFDIKLSVTTFELDVSIIQASGVETINESMPLVDNVPNASTSKLAASEYSGSVDVSGVNTTLEFGTNELVDMLISVESSVDSASDSELVGGLIRTSESARLIVVPSTSVETSE